MHLRFSKEICTAIRFAYWTLGGGVIQSRVRPLSMGSGCELMRMKFQVKQDVTLLINPNWPIFMPFAVGDLINANRFKTPNPMPVTYAGNSAMELIGDILLNTPMDWAFNLSWMIPEENRPSAYRNISPRSGSI